MSSLKPVVMHPVVAEMLTPTKRIRQYLEENGGDANIGELPSAGAVSVAHDDGTNDGEAWGQTYFEGLSNRGLHTSILVRRVPEEVGE